MSVYLIIQNFVDMQCTVKLLYNVIKPLRNTSRPSLIIVQFVFKYLKLPARENPSRGLASFREVVILNNELFVFVTFLLSCNQSSYTNACF